MTVLQSTGVETEKLFYVLWQSDSEYHFRPVRHKVAVTGPIESVRPISQFCFTIPIARFVQGRLCCGRGAQAVAGCAVPIFRRVNRGLLSSMSLLFGARSFFRDPQNHYFTMVIISAIASMALSAFLLPLAATTDRLNIPLNLLLVLVAFKYSISSSLPSVPYLTFLDKYIFVCFGFLFAAFSLAGGISLHHIGGGGDVDGRDGEGRISGEGGGADRAALVFLAVALVGVNVLFARSASLATKNGEARIGAMGKVSGAREEIAANGAASVQTLCPCVVTFNHHVCPLPVGSFNPVGTD